MKIVQLTAENVKRLKAVEITPTGDIVELVGDCRSGKSCIMDAMWWAMGGEGVHQDDPIRHGQTDAFVELDLGEMTVRRTWKKSDKGVRSGLKVVGKNGETYASPQTLLSDLFGDLTFNPGEFSDMSPNKQRDLLMELCGIGDELAKLDATRKQLFDDRTEVNRDCARLSGRAFREEIAALNFDDIAEMQEVSVADVVAELERAQGKAAEYNQMLATLQARETALEEIDARISEMERTLIETKENRQYYVKDNVEQKSIVDALQWPDVDAIKERLASVEIDNRWVREAKEYAEHVGKLSEADLESKDLTEDIESLDEEKAGILSKAKFPIRGLGFSDDYGVVFDGSPFEQCSSGEQILVGSAIGMALKPKLRVLRINKGSLLDKKLLASLETMAKRRDFQIWIERVEAGTDAAILIEDGHVREMVKDTV